jgi:hypothetical protein
MVFSGLIVLVCTSCKGAIFVKTETEQVSFVVELANTNRDLLDSIKIAVNYNEAALFASTNENEEVIYWSGELEGAEINGLEGIESIDGHVRYVRETDVFRDAFWNLAIEYDGFDVGNDTVSGDTSFDVQEHLFESSFEYQDFSGDLEWNGVTHEIDYLAHFTANMYLQSIVATVDGEELSWETLEPQEP